MPSAATTGSVMISIDIGHISWLSTTYGWASENHRQDTYKKCDRNIHDGQGKDAVVRTALGHLEYSLHIAARCGWLDTGHNAALS